jgi:hypothetical protein
MKKSVKAALLSALVLPGAGHFLLKSYLRGAILLASSLWSVTYIIKITMDRANVITEKILSGQIPFDIDVIREQLTALPEDSQITSLNIALYVFIACWVIGVIDAGRIGHLQDKPPTQ